VWRGSRVEYRLCLGLDVARGGLGHGLGQVVGRGIGIGHVHGIGIGHGLGIAPGLCPGIDHGLDITLGICDVLHHGHRISLGHGLWSLIYGIGLGLSILFHV
jgi:hypothetical protein